MVRLRCLPGLLLVAAQLDRARGVTAGPAQRPQLPQAAAAAAAVTDPRALTSGLVMLEDVYLDQPYCVVWPGANSSRTASAATRTDDGRVWVCTITRNSQPEGNPGEHVEVLRSPDNGVSWQDNQRL